MVPWMVLMSQEKPSLSPDAMLSPQVVRVWAILVQSRALTELNEVRL